MGDLLGPGHLDHPAGKPGVGVGAQGDVRAVAQLADDVGSVAGAGVGHVHGDAEIGLYPEGGGDAALEAGLLLGGGRQHQVDRQGLALQQLHSIQQAHQAGPVVKGLSAQSVALQLHGVIGKGHEVAHPNGLFGLFAGHADVHHHLGNGYGFLVISGLLQMGRHSRHDAQDGALFGQNHQFAAQQHPLVHAAHGGKAQKALPGDLCHQKADLVDVGIQQQGFRPGDAAVLPAQHIAEVVDVHPVKIRLHHLRGDAADPELIA